ncbi:MAG: hypothetical protein ABJF88_17615 [Rhodothermales bacterium]
MNKGIRFGWVFLASLLVVGPAWAQYGEDDHGDGHGDSNSRFSDEPIPLADIPDRPRPLLELGPKFLGTGNINQGFTLPTGAVWTPAFMLFGTIRTATQGIENGVADRQVAEAVARFDLFGNLYLTPTERIVAGVSPLNQEGRFTSFTLVNEVGGAPVLVNGEEPDDFQEELNFRINTLFFEGDIAEIFPKIDWDDSSPLDYYLSVGRQPLSFQDGLLINEDALDMVGLTRANMRMGGLINTRAAAVFGWGDVNRHSSLGGGFGDCDELFAAGAAAFGNCMDDSALLFGLFTETDTRKRTIEIDAMYVLADDSTGDGVYAGIGSTQRIGEYNNTFRIVGSYPVGKETVFNQAGVVIHNQFGFTPHHTHNWVYVNLFGGIGQFRSAARGPGAGGPLGQTGLLFAAVGLGRYGAALGNQADESVGGGIGYQMFFGTARRQQLILEAGGRYTYGSGPDIFTQDIAAGAVRYSFAVGRRGTIILDGFGAYDLNASQPNFGTRVELAIQL